MTAIVARAGRATRRDCGASRWERWLEHRRQVARDRLHAEEQIRQLRYLVLALAAAYDDVTAGKPRRDGKPSPFWLSDVATELRETVKETLA